MGGAAFGSAILVVGLTLGRDAISFYDPAWYVVPTVLVALMAIYGTASRGIHHYRIEKTPSILATAADALKYILTLHLSLQIGLGCTSATAAILLERALAMPPEDALVISLFTIFVFVMSSAFTSFFMRSLIPWRSEHPRFSNAVAYILSVLLGLIAAAATFASKSTIGTATSLGMMFYQGALGLATLAATLVGAYIVVMRRKHGVSTSEGDSS